MSDPKKFLKNKKLVGSFLSCVALFAAFVTVSVAAFFGTKAWFAANDKTSAGGMSLTAKDDFIAFGNTFTAKAVMNSSVIAEGTFKRGDGDDYYLIDETTGDFSLDESGNKQTLFYGSLYPGEYIELSLKITCVNERRGGGYRLSLSNLKNSETFTATDGKTYSVLGLYRVKTVTYDESGEATLTDKGFLADYNDESGKIPDDFIVTEGIFDESLMDENGYITVNFRLYIDLEQYKTIPNTTSNMLSEKTINIGSITLEPKEGE